MGHDMYPDKIQALAQEARYQPKRPFQRHHGHIPMDTGHIGGLASAAEEIAPGSTSLLSDRVGMRLQTHIVRSKQSIEVIAEQLQRLFGVPPQTLEIKETQGVAAIFPEGSVLGNFEYQTTQAEFVANKLELIAQALRTI